MRIAIASLCLVLGAHGAPRVEAQPAAAAAAPAFAAARFQQVTGAGGVPLNVVETGDPAKPSVLLIHGYRQSYLSWSRQFASALATRCHLVAFDLRGHGNSGSPWEAAAYDSSRPWADDVAAVIAATGLSRPLVVGWSFGGNVVMDFLRHYPEAALAGVVLVDSGAGLFPPPAPPPDAPPRPTAMPDLKQNIAAVERSVDMVFGSSLDPALHRAFTAAAMRVSPFVDRGVASRPPGSNADLVASLGAPVTLVFGEQDPIVPAAMADKLASGFPTATRIDFEGAGHAPFLDDPERFNRLIDEMHCSAASGAPATEN